MANLTQTLIRQYVRAFVGEKDFANLRDALMNQMINFGIRKVQQDVIDRNIKVFNKQAYLTGTPVAVPTDLLNLPNAIIDIKASTGTKSASTVITGSTCVMSFTLREPTTNSWTITWATGSALAMTISPSTRAVTITYRTSATVTTNAQVLALLNADTIFNFYFDTVTATASGENVNVSNGTITNVNGNTGTGWLPTRELSIESFNHDTANNYLTPTATEIMYKLNGNSSGTVVLEFVPNSVTYSYIFYYYRLTELTSDNDVSPIPPEYEELLIIDVAIRCYLVLKKSAEAVQQKQYYQDKADALQNDYIALLVSRTKDKTRLKEENPND